MRRVEYVLRQITYFQEIQVLCLDNMLVHLNLDSQRTYRCKAPSTTAAIPRNTALHRIGKII